MAAPTRPVPNALAAIMLAAMKAVEVKINAAARLGFWVRGG